MKVFPLLKELERRADQWRPVLIHSGQHYDFLMNDVFFDDFGVRRPNHCLGVGSGPHGAQTARVMIALEELFQRERPDMLVVVGDVNSTMAGALVAVKMGIPVAHLEAGLRSGDRSMPEEINRIVTDAVSDLLLTPSEDADLNLRREGIPENKIERVGNIMIDSLVQVLPKARDSRTWEQLGLRERAYVLVTLHRPSNVDDPARLARIVNQLEELSRKFPVVFPVHPRTQERLKALGLLPDPFRVVSHQDATTSGGLRPDFREEAKNLLSPNDRTGVRFLAPLGYKEFLSLESAAAAVITDSGGIQEETSYLGIPCLTLRPNTERPLTINMGTNRLIDLDSCDLSAEVDHAILRWRHRNAPKIPLWDGHTAERVAKVLEEFLWSLGHTRK